MIAPPPVTVVSCNVTLQGNTRQAGGVDITYVNAGTTVLHRVTFDVGYHTLEADIRRTVDDEGTFAPVEVILPPGKLISAEGNAPLGYYQTPLSTGVDSLIASMACLEAP